MGCANSCSVIQKIEEPPAPAFECACAFIEANLRKTLRVDDLCRAAHARERTLRRAFRQAVGMGPTAYIRTRRLAHARNLLRGRRVRSVTEAAYDAGFDHLGRFADAYKTMFGELPSATLSEKGQPEPLMSRALTRHGAALRVAAPPRRPGSPCRRRTPDPRDR